MSPQPIPQNSYCNPIDFDRNDRPVTPEPNVHKKLPTCGILQAELQSELALEQFSAGVLRTMVLSTIPLPTWSLEALCGGDEAAGYTIIDVPPSHRGCKRTLVSKSTNSAGSQCTGPQITPCFLPRTSLDAIGTSPTGLPARFATLDAKWCLKHSFLSLKAECR